MPDLTKTEQYILDQRLAKVPFKAIAMDLGISLGSVAQHHARARDKLGARTFAGAVRMWRAHCITNAEWRST